MSDLTHLYHVGQKVLVLSDEKLHKGTVTETQPDHIIVDVPDISDHMYYERELNLDCVFPDYNFTEEK